MSVSSISNICSKYKVYEIYANTNAPENWPYESHSTISQGDNLAAFANLNLQLIIFKERFNLGTLAIKFYICWHVIKVNSSLNKMSLFVHVLFIKICQTRIKTDQYILWCRVIFIIHLKGLDHFILHFLSVVIIHVKYRSEGTSFSRIRLNYWLHTLMENNLSLGGESYSLY